MTADDDKHEEEEQQEREGEQDDDEDNDHNLEEPKGAEVRCRRGRVMTAPKEIKTLVERFERNREAYRSSAYNETQLRQEFIDPLVHKKALIQGKIGGKPYLLRKSKGLTLNKRTLRLDG
jgi:hypothetical protein